MQKEKKEEILAISLITAGIFILLALATFKPGQISLYTFPPDRPTGNFGGVIGAHISGALFFLIGVSSYVIPALFLIWGVNRFAKTSSQRPYTRIAGTLILILSASSLASIIADGAAVSQFDAGGAFGFFLSGALVKYCGVNGSYLILFSLLVLSLILATEFMVFPFLRKSRVFIVNSYQKLKSAVTTRQVEVKRRSPAFERPRQVKQEPPEPRPAPQEPRKVEYAIHKAKARTAKPTVASAGAAPKPPRAAKEKPMGEYKLPSLDLLSSPPPIEERKIKEDLKTNSEILEATLLDFDIEAKVVRVEQGPVITRYELEPAPGVKINRITALGDNIALAMKAQSVRIVAPIPGKGTIGFEVPNSSSTVVYLKEVMDSEEFRGSGSKLSLALGKDITGKPVIADLADMPHLLIAGTTGSGKTVCVNCLIMSLLFSMSPREVRFLMVDPKMVELAIFNGLPHLLCPVVTDAKKAAASLNWVVNEMENRYKMLAQAAARNIDAFNAKVEKAGSGSRDSDDKPLTKLPYIIVIIDELADLMVVAKDNIENAITRLAQLSRAVGIHIILATQRPSVDVITGVIKANFPARVSFKVASKVDSRTVLDINGADKLLGRGDMLFIEPGAARPVRAQGSLIGDGEIERIVEVIKAQGDTMYDDAILSVQEKKAAGKVFEKDELFDEAVRVVLATRQASVSMLQRKLGLGYTRAARLIDAMEDEGIVGSYRGSKPREILISSEESAAEKS